jgi:hypothetical protein
MDTSCKQQLHFFAHLKCNLLHIYGTEECFAQFVLIKSYGVWRG